MYTSELLEEKYRAQKKILAKAGNSQERYFEIVTELAKELYKKKGWDLVYSKRNGGFDDLKTTN
jgi:hypothetical protein